MITLLRNVNVYSPTHLGMNDILIANDKIAAIAPAIHLSSDAVRVIDGQGLAAMPGLVDSLVHITGGGGEGGFHTRTPEMQLTEASLHGVTTVIGALGTDATTRSLEELVAKAKALNYEGISAYCYTGSYHLPPPTITGSVTKDIMLIDPIIGIGEVAIAEHRSSQPTVTELAKVAAEASVGGMLSNKKGIVSIHTGDSEEKLQMLHRVVDESDIPAHQFYPTHINRNQSLLEAGKAWAQRGGYIDMTTSTNAQFIAEGEIPAADAIAWCLQQGISATQLTMSSDGNASLPVFDNHGQLVGLEVGRVASLFNAFSTLASTSGVSMEQAIRTVSTSSADILKLPTKGRLIAGSDADIVLFDATTFDIHHVFAKGQHMTQEGVALVKGTFEDL